MLNIWLRNVKYLVNKKFNFMIKKNYLIQKEKTKKLMIFLKD